MNSVPEILVQAAQTYDERNRIYGDNYKQFGHSMSAIFPKGLTINSPEDWNKLGIFIQVMSKITRYANSFENGHIDSAHDACVYSAMLEELTREYSADRN